MRIREDLGRGVEIGEGIRITNDAGLARRIVTPAIERSIGSLEADALRGAEVILCGDVPGASSGTEQLATLSTLMDAAATFLLSLWSVRDHGAHFELAYLGREQQISSNMKSNAPTPTSGKFAGLTEFTRDEIEAAAPRLRLWKKPLSATRLTRDADRLERALYFLQSARATTDAAIKVAQYCVCFETLVGTAITEVTHRLSERIAVLLESDAEKRREVYTLVHRAYSTRSMVLHGTALKEGKVDNLADLARDCDELLRRLLRRLVDDRELRQVFARDASSLEEFFRLSRRICGRVKREGLALEIASRDRMTPDLHGE